MKQRLDFGHQILRHVSSTRCGNGRQPYGRQVEKQLAKTLGCHYTVITRHRAFAEKYDSIDQVYEAYGYLVTWNDLRDGVNTDENLKYRKPVKVKHVIEHVEQTLHQLKMLEAAL